MQKRHARRVAEDRILDPGGATAWHGFLNVRLDVTAIVSHPNGEEGRHFCDAKWQNR